jgi:hypothetical protein
MSGGDELQFSNSNGRNIPRDLSQQFTLDVGTLNPHGLLETAGYEPTPATVASPAYARFLARLRDLEDLTVEGY